jgi:dolichol-phosphate mannosyltransferase
MKLITLLIPVFRNSGSLFPTYEGITALFKNELKDFDYEFVFVNDGSDDDSLKELLELREKDKKVRVFSLSRNFGQRYAVLCGFARAAGALR